MSNPIPLAPVTARARLIRRLLPWLIVGIGVAIFLAGCTISALTLESSGDSLLSWSFASLAGGTALMLGSMGLAEIVSDFPRARRIR